MAKKRLLEKFENRALGEKDSACIKGGFAIIPGFGGSTGYVNWDEVDIRDGEGLLPLSPGSTKSNKMSFGRIRP
jgi:hypothetical protein